MEEEEESQVPQMLRWVTVRRIGKGEEGGPQSGEKGEGRPSGMSNGYA